MIRRNGWFVANNVVVCCIGHTVWTIDETNETFFIVFLLCECFFWCHHVSPMNYFHRRPGSVLLKMHKPICEPWCWNMYQHLPLKNPCLFAGKYTSTMHHLVVHHGFFHFPAILKNGPWGRSPGREASSFDDRSELFDQPETWDLENWPYPAW